MLEFLPQAERFELPSASAFDFTVKAEAGEPLCRKCGLDKLGATCPKMMVQGQGQKRLMIIVSHPSAADDLTGQYFSGQSGDAMKAYMRTLGIDLMRDCWVLGALACRPMTPPKADHVRCCRPAVLDAIERLKPVVILLVGRLSVVSVVGHAWKDSIDFLDPWCGWAIPDQKYNAWLCPVWSAAEMFDATRDIQLILKREHIKDAVSLLSVGEPYPDGPIDYTRCVDVVMDPLKGAKRLRDIIKSKRAAAIDYETNCLKGHGPQSKIVCVSYSTGIDGETFASPMIGPMIDAHREFVASENDKIASNQPFEHGWTLAQYQQVVQNWAWDTMNSAHVQHSVPGVTSIKFQSYVHLGQGSYNDHIAPYLESGQGGYGINQIHKIDPHELLLYCGMDSLLEYEVARCQVEATGWSHQREWVRW